MLPIYLSRFGNNSIDPKKLLLIHEIGLRLPVLLIIRDAQILTETSTKARLKLALNGERECKIRRSRPGLSAREEESTNYLGILR